MSAMQPEARSPDVSRQWQKQAVLTEAVLEPLYHLNWDFLTNLARQPRQWRPVGAGTRLPDPIGAELLLLTPEHRRSIARCPFSLFSAHFHDAACWEDLTSGRMPANPLAATSAAESSVRGELIDFGQLALFYAWHLARSNPSAARVVLGMVDGTLEIFRRVALSRLQVIAVERTDVFAPRWPERVTFWRTLLANASVRPGTSPVDARLLGLQMLAADVNGCCGPRQGATAPARRAARI